MASDQSNSEKATQLLVHLADLNDPGFTPGVALALAEKLAHIAGGDGRGTYRIAHDPDTAGCRVLALTMTTDAAKQFWRALVWAAGKAEDAGPKRDETRDWLNWGHGRLGYALLQVDPEAFSDAAS